MNFKHSILEGGHEVWAETVRMKINVYFMMFVIAGLLIPLNSRATPDLKNAITIGNLLDAEKQRTTNLLVIESYLKGLAEGFIWDDMILHKKDPIYCIGKYAPSGEDMRKLVDARVVKDMQKKSVAEARDEPLILVGSYVFIDTYRCKK